MQTRLPFTPPLQTVEFAAPGGRIGDRPEDFVVDEVPLYPFSGNGEHRLVRVRKRSMTTQDAVQSVARALSVNAADIGFAGMKDKHAVTTQWLSVPGSTPDPDTWLLPEGLQLLEATRHTNKLRTGHLRANAFRIRVVDVQAIDGAPRIVEALRSTGLVNFFGSQRFGHGGANLERALGWAEAGTSRKGRSRFSNKLWPSVLQAEVFNQYAARRIAEGPGLLAGDVVRLEGSGSVFVVEDAEAERPRLEAGDVHLTGPIFGPKMRAASGGPGDLEQAAIDSLGLSDETLRAMGKRASGTRRDLYVAPERLEAIAESEGRLLLSFTLPAGSYATQLVREFTRTPFLDPLPRPARPEP